MLASGHRNLRAGLLFTGNGKVWTWWVDSDQHCGVSLPQLQMRTATFWREQRWDDLESSASDCVKVASRPDCRLCRSWWYHICESLVLLTCTCFMTPNWKRWAGIDQVQEATTLACWFVDLEIKLAAWLSRTLGANFARLKLIVHLLCVCVVTYLSETGVASISSSLALDAITLTCLLSAIRSCSM